jgi:hypothetical protein
MGVSCASSQGMIYTPPTFSDHIAVSLVLHDLLPAPAPAIKLGSDKQTRAAQPFRKQRRIGEMFAQSAAAAAAAAAAATAAGDENDDRGRLEAADAVVARQLQASLRASQGRPRRPADRPESGAKTGLSRWLVRGAVPVAAAVSPFLECIGSPCLRHCVHGAPIGSGGGGGGWVSRRWRWASASTSAAAQEAPRRWWWWQILRWAAEHRPALCTQDAEDRPRGQVAACTPA